MGDGPPGFPRGFSCPAVLRWLSEVLLTYPTGLSPSLARLSIRSGCLKIFLLHEGSATPSDSSYNPCDTTPAGCLVLQVWASPLSLATTWGIAFAFFSWGYLDVSIPPVRAFASEHYSGTVALFRHPRLYACLAAPRGFSQPSTSFFASRRLGILRAPFLAWSSLLKSSKPT